MKRIILSLAVVLFTAILSAQNVGINTTTPQATLDVNGTLKVGSLTGATDQMVVSDANGNISVMPLPTPDQIVNLTGSGATTITGTYPNFTISSTDNVDDADADPANEIQSLNLAGNVLGISSGNTVDLTPILSSSVWSQSGSNAFYDTGNVGIGNTNPGNLLEIRVPDDSSALSGTDVDFSNLGLMLSSGSNSTIDQAVGLGFGSSSNFPSSNPSPGAAIIHQRTGGSSAGALHFATKSTTAIADIPIRMTINSTGNVGIGNMNPSDKLHVDGNIRVADDADIFGLDVIQGFNDLRLFGDATGGPDLTIAANGAVSISQYTGVGVTFNNVSLNVRSIANTVANDEIFQVENSTGLDLFGVQNDQDVFVTGNFSVAGTKNFILDHPLDPANKSLVHNAVEAAGYITYYNGTVVLDANGTATVSLPSYYEALNTNSHYQLTCVGGFAQVYIAEEIAKNQFKIAGGTPGLKVSWQVTAERHDPWATDHPYEAELDKTGSENGRYWYPQGYGQPMSKHIGHDDDEKSSSDR